MSIPWFNIFLIVMFLSFSFFVFDQITKVHTDVLEIKKLALQQQSSAPA